MISYGLSSFKIGSFSSKMRILNLQESSRIGSIDMWFSTSWLISSDYSILFSSETSFGKWFEQLCDEISSNSLWSIKGTAVSVLINCFFFFPFFWFFFWGYYGRGAKTLNLFENFFIKWSILDWEFIKSFACNWISGDSLWIDRKILSKRSSFKSYSFIKRFC